MEAIKLSARSPALTRYVPAAKACCTSVTFSVRTSLIVAKWLAPALTVAESPAPAIAEEGSPGRTAEAVAPFTAADVAGETARVAAAGETSSIFILTLLVVVIGQCREDLNESSLMIQALS
jgi:hypothetical protein